MIKTVKSTAMFVGIVALIVAPVPPTTIIGLALLKSDKVRSQMSGWQLASALVVDKMMTWAIRSVFYAALATAPVKDVKVVAPRLVRDETHIQVMK